MKAVYFRHDCVLAKDQSTVEVLQMSGIGARVLNPIVTSTEGVVPEDPSPLLLLDEEVKTYGLLFDFTNIIAFLLL